MSNYEKTHTHKVWRGKVDEALSGARLDVFISAHLKDTGLSRAKVQDLIRGGRARVNGKVCAKPNYRLAAGESVSLDMDSLPDWTGALTPEPGGVDLVYEDEHVVVLDKPAGLTVHPAPGRPDKTLVHRLLSRFPHLAKLDPARPGIVHRLDKDTSGLILVALDERSRIRLSREFARRKVYKEYLALVHGRPKPEAGEINVPLGRDPRNKTKMAVTPKGREARSAYEVIWPKTAEKGGFSLVRVKIFTGRTHQIRVHLDHIGHPVFGDTVYGARQHKEWLDRSGLNPRLASRQMLHAWKLGFTHPETDERMMFCAPPPRDFERLPLLLSRTCMRVVVTGAPGCGKSALLLFLSDEGIPVFSADREVAALYEPGADGRDLLKKRFGRVYVPDHGPVDKAALFQDMLGSRALRQEVMDLIHPLVKHRLREFFRLHADKRAAAAEVPLFFEAGW
ncbi:MAG: dephospho-CoA kinase, partial [Thermodesulfobacteriota bacterium]|nr:dephospho-CoA kinase [Thermodesulfobacteriota bacterium]